MYSVGITINETASAASNGMYEGDVLQICGKDVTDLLLLGIVGNFVTNPGDPSLSPPSTASAVPSVVVDTYTGRYLTLPFLLFWTASATTLLLQIQAQAHRPHALRCRAGVLHRGPARHLHHRHHPPLLCAKRHLQDRPASFTAAAAATCSCSSRSSGISKSSLMTFCLNGSNK